MTMDAVMYGMTPSAKIDSCSIAPPEKRFTRPMKFSEALFIEPTHCWTTLSSTPGVGMNEPIR